MRAQSFPAAARRLLNPRQAGAIQRITNEAQQDLEAAERNFKYFSQRGQKFCERGIATTELIKKMSNEKKQEALADSIRKFTQTVGEQFEGHYQELKEQYRLGTKPTPVLAQFSVDKTEDADLAYEKPKKSGKKTITTTTAKEIKAVSTDRPGSVTSVLKDASEQLELREADKKKALIVITEPTNTWPVHGNKKNPTEIDMKKAFEKQIEKLKLPTATHIKVQGISVDNNTYAASAKITGKGSYTFAYEKMEKHPGEPSPLKVASTSSGNQTKSNQKSGSGSDSDSS